MIKDLGSINKDLNSDLNRKSFEIRKTQKLTVQIGDIARKQGLDMKPQGFFSWGFAQERLHDPDYNVEAGSPNPRYKEKFSCKYPHCDNAMIVSLASVASKTGTGQSNRGIANTDCENLQVTDPIKASVLNLGNFVTERADAVRKLFLAGRFGPKVLSGRFLNKSFT